MFQFLHHQMEYIKIMQILGTMWIYRKGDFMFLSSKIKTYSNAVIFFLFLYISLKIIISPLGLIPFQNYLSVHRVRIEQKGITFDHDI